MTHAIAFYLPWLLSAITITSTIMAGNMHRGAWALSGLNQILWFIWIVASQNWGLLPMNVVLAVIFARNHLKWNPKVLRTRAGPARSCPAPSPGWNCRCVIKPVHTESFGPGGPTKAELDYAHSLPCGGPL